MIIPCGETLNAFCSESGLHILMCVSLCCIVLFVWSSNKAFSVAGFFDKMPKKNPGATSEVLKMMPLAPMIRPLKVIELNPFSSFNNQESLNVYGPIRAYRLWVVYVCDEHIKTDWVYVPWDFPKCGRKAEFTACSVSVKSRAVQNGHQAQWAGVCFSQPATLVSTLWHVRLTMNERDVL